MQLLQGVWKTIVRQILGCEAHENISWSMMQKTFTGGMVVGLCLVAIPWATGCRTQSGAYADFSGGTNAAQVSESLGAIPYDVLDDDHKLSPGDRVTFRIEQDKEDEPKPLLVTDAGDLEIPYLGRVAAAGKTCKQLAAEIKGVLEKKYYREATVFLGVDLMSKTKGKIYLAGRVRFPGYLDIPTDEVFTVSKAVLRAGGFTEFADKRHVKVTRNISNRTTERETLTVDITEVLEKGQAGKDFELKPDDRVFVPSRLVNF
jgi:protein involved in polysaccharide export with SLBB domain